MAISYASNKANVYTNQQRECYCFDSLFVDFHVLYPPCGLRLATLHLLQVLVAVGSGRKCFLFSLLERYRLRQLSRFLRFVRVIDQVLLMGSELVILLHKFVCFRF